MNEIAGVILGEVKSFLTVKVNSCKKLSTLSGTPTSVKINFAEIARFCGVLSVWHTHNSFNLFPSRKDYLSAIKLRKKNIKYITIYSTQFNFALSYKIKQVYIFYILIPVIFVNNSQITRCIREVVESRT